MVSTPGFELWPHWWVACDVLSPMLHPCSPVRPLLTSSRQEMKFLIAFCTKLYLCDHTKSLHCNACQSFRQCGYQKWTDGDTNHYPSHSEQSGNYRLRRLVAVSLRKNAFKILKRFSYLLRKWFYLCLLLFSTSSSESPKTDWRKKSCYFFFEITLIYYYLCTADQSYDGCLYTRLLS